MVRLFLLGFSLFTLFTFAFPGIAFGCRSCRDAGSWTSDNYSAIEYTHSGKYLSTTREAFELPDELVFGKDRPVTQSACDAYQLVLLHAGASKRRDACDQRIVDEVKNGTGFVPDSQDEVGGWPELISLPAPVDVDQDGMADDWELANALNPENPEDRNGDRDSDGYTNLEEYIKSLAHPKARSFRGFREDLTPRFAPLAKQRICLAISALTRYVFEPQC